MTHDELLAKIDYEMEYNLNCWSGLGKATRAVVELHKPKSIPDWVPTEAELICWCAHIYPCPTIQAIEKELA